jgi:hypothetical protein
MTYELTLAPMYIVPQWIVLKKAHSYFDSTPSLPATIRSPLPPTQRKERLLSIFDSHISVNCCDFLLCCKKINQNFSAKKFYYPHLFWDGIKFSEYTGTVLCSSCNGAHLKVHKNENFFGSDIEFCTISSLVMLKY